jgi:hypothetical protein
MLPPSLASSGATTSSFASQTGPFGPATPSCCWTPGARPTTSRSTTSTALRGGPFGRCSLAPRRR